MGIWEGGTFSAKKRMKKIRVAYMGLNGSLNLYNELLDW